MREKISKLVYTIIISMLIITVVSFVLWVLGSIIVNSWEIPIEYKFSTAIGTVAGIFFVKFIVKLFIEGIDMKEFYRDIAKDELPQKKYKFKIVYKNKDEIEAYIKAHNLEEVKELLLSGKINFINQGKTMMYFDNEEIQYCEVNEVEE